MAFPNPARITGPDELRQLLAGLCEDKPAPPAPPASNVFQRIPKRRHKTRAPPKVTKLRPMKKMTSPETLQKALRLSERLVRVHPSQRPGSDVASHFIPPTAGRRRKRIARMLAVPGAMPVAAASSGFTEALRDCKTATTVNSMRAVSAGVASVQVGSDFDVPKPSYDAVAQCVSWANLQIPVVLPQVCQCGQKQLLLRYLGRYGPVAVLDASTIHFALRGDAWCTSCRKNVYCTMGGVREHFAQKGIHVVVGETRGDDALAKVFGGVGSGRKCIAHTPAFITTLYGSFQADGAFEACRVHYCTKVASAALEERPMNSYAPLVAAYGASFVPATVTLTQLLKHFHSHLVIPQVLEVQRDIARRSRIWKIDGHRKGAKRVAQGLEGPQTAILPVMTEEGCLAFPPPRVRGEGRAGFRQGLAPALDFHKEANKDAPDKGALRALGTDDYEHCRGPLGELCVEWWKEEYPFRDACAVADRLDKLEEAALNGSLGLLCFQDTKHKDIDLEHHSPKASSSFPRLRDAFSAQQARFAAPKAPAGVRKLTPRVPASSVPCADALRKVVHSSRPAFLAWKDNAANKSQVDSARLLLQHPDVLLNRRWKTTFGYLPPWTEVEHVANRFAVKLHSAALPWCYETHADYLAEKEKVRDWFTHVLPGTHRRVGIDGHAEAQAEEPAIGAPHPCINKAVQTLMDNCGREVYLRGCFNWSGLCRMARSVGLEMASGTTDVEVLCSEIIGIFRAGRISRMGEEAFSMHMDLLFLRLARRRSHASLRTIISHGKDRFGQELAILLDLVQWFTESEPQTIAARWQDALDTARAATKATGSKVSKKKRKRESSDAPKPSKVPN